MTTKVFSSGGFLRKLNFSVFITGKMGRIADAIKSCDFKTLDGAAHPGHRKGPHS